MADLGKPASQQPAVGHAGDQRLPSTRSRALTGARLRIPLADVPMQVAPDQTARGREQDQWTVCSAYDGVPAKEKSKRIAP